jgi:hypothetical protein
LALAPEYSFPWEVLNQIIENASLQPAKGKLWCFGMQYKSLEEFECWCTEHNTQTLQEFADTDQKNRSIAVIFDGLRVKKTFVDALAYIFLNSHNNITIMLQSKLAHMKDPLYEFEASDLSLGNHVYLFDYGNFNTKIFCSLICADVMNSES